MLAKALSRTWGQLLDPTFRSVAAASLVAATATLILLTAGLAYIWPTEFTTGWDWVDSALTWADEFALGLTTLIAWYLLFPALVTGVMSIFIEKIALAVEREWYPNRLGRRDVPFAEALWNGLKFALLVIALNLLAVIPYLLLFVLGVVGAPLLFLVLNGYLLGREFFEMVAVRHMRLGQAHMLRRQASATVLLTGVLMAGLFLIPVVNLMAPIIGAAAMTHVFHALVAKYGLPHREG